MMNDAISRSAALQQMDKYIDMAIYESQVHHAMCVVAEYIKEAPTIDAVPVKRAKWIPHRPGDVHACSNCGFGVLPSNWFMNGRCFGPVIWHNKFRFCPYCGAKMVNAKMDGDPGEDP